MMLAASAIPLSCAAHVGLGLRALGQAVLLAAALGLGACADMKGIEPVAVLRDASSFGLQAVNRDAGPQIPGANEWWREFGDPQLNGLVAQALSTNPSLKLAQARFARAQSATQLASASSSPQIVAEGNLTHQQFSKNGLVPPQLAGAVADTGTLQFSGTWELDFFGKNRAALDAALGSANAAQADAQAARVLLASTVVRAYFQALRLNEQIALAQAMLVQREATLGLVRERVNAGLDTRLELKLSEGAIPEVRGQMEALQEQINLVQNTLAALVGEPKVPLTLVNQPLVAINNIAPVQTVPSDLLGRRADIWSARWRVEAARHDVANAKTQFYPNLNLMAFAGFSSIGLDRLLDAGSVQWGAGPALRLPLFEGGRLRANLAGKTADYDAAVESYNTTVIDAIHEVADQLVSVQSIARQQTHQRAALEATDHALEIAVQRYQAGLGTYLHVLAAQTPVFNQRRLGIDLAARALDAKVVLIRTIGGGYQPEPKALTTSHSSVTQASTP
jgi:NodT family efflux transporter outer membrane factor (OMF) lipoprotein